MWAHSANGLYHVSTRFWILSETVRCSQHSSSCQASFGMSLIRTPISLSPSSLPTAFTSGCVCYKAMRRLGVLLSGLCSASLRTSNVFACILMTQLLMRRSSTSRQNVRSWLSRLEEHNLEQTPSKTRIGATTVFSLGHSVIGYELCPNLVEISVLSAMPTPKDVGQLRSQS